MCSRRKLKAFEREALEHRGDLFAVALKYSRNEKDAEDLVQETLTKAFAAWDSFNSGTNCRAWLFRILTNNYINEYRRLIKQRSWASREEPMISSEQRHAALDPEGVFMEKHLGDEVLYALQALPDEFRNVIVLADLQGLSYREISSSLACPLGTVMSRLHRARRLMESALGRYAKEMGIVKVAPAAA
jgi:RNA polymerase sigma-70 factor, ECF subfamily